MGVSYSDAVQFCESPLQWYHNHDPAIVECPNGDLLAFGRGMEIDGWMPKSISSDMGATWEAVPSGFAPIGGTQRCVLLRLQDGPLLFASFAADPWDPEPVS